MDLQISGRWAIVCGASKGLGRACAEALAAEGVNLVINARNAEPLEQTAEALRERYGVTVVSVAADVTAETGQSQLLSACPQPDILINNAGGPPPGDFRDWGRADWDKALEANMLTPIFLIKQVVDGMMARGFGRIVNITSSAVKAPIPILGLSNGARAGLTGFIAGLARETVAHNVTINNLLPGPFETDRLTTALQAEADKVGVTVDRLREQKQQLAPARRFGKPEEFGAACAFLCSAQAGYISGQNWVLDGGAFPGTL
ncbi:SDR family oxidoreductase [Ferrimonas gelatinilytica]|uniref:SDR family oxidoreductase n=1 Tax=Ferrimonas gelatinilytica TaxID=1255257 RepID=A0ABP9S9C6_9GAMM